MPTVGIDLAHLDGKIRHIIGYQGNQGNQGGQGDIIPEGEISPAANFGLESPPQSPPQSPPILPSEPKTLAQFLSNLHRDIESNVIGVGMLGYLPLEYVWNIGDRLGTALRQGGIQAAKIESDKIAKELVQAGIKIPSQAIQMGKAVIGETKQTITHPIQSFYDRPLSTTLTAANIAGLAALAKEPAVIAAKRLINTGKLTSTEAIRILQSQKGFARYSADDLDRMFNNWDELIQAGTPQTRKPPNLDILQTLSQQTGLGQSQIFNIATSIYRPTSQPVTLQEFLRHPIIHQAMGNSRELRETFTNAYNQIRVLPDTERERLSQQLSMPAQSRVGIENTMSRTLTPVPVNAERINTIASALARNNATTPELNIYVENILRTAPSLEDALRQFHRISDRNLSQEIAIAIRDEWQHIHQPPTTTGQQTIPLPQTSAQQRQP